MASSPESVTAEQVEELVRQSVDERKIFWRTDEKLRASLPEVSPEDRDYLRRELAAIRAASARATRAGEETGVFDLDPDPEPDPEPDRHVEALVEELLPHLSMRKLFSVSSLSPEVDLRMQLDLMREHLKITRKKPKTQRGRGRPKGSALLEIPIKKSVNLWMDGYTHKEIHEKVDPARRIDPLTLKRSLQRKIHNSLPERQAQIKAAHEAARLRKKKAQ